MPGIIISDPEGLISAEIMARRETYYLVTDDNLRDLRSKSILTDLFTLIASILWGAFISTQITLNASVGLPSSTERVLSTYATVFMWGAILFTVLALVFAALTYVHMRNVKRSVLPPPEEDSEETAASTT